MNELLGLPYSPWTEKARWALDARHVPYDFRIYSPVLGEPALRLKLGRWRGRVSVPVLTAAQGQVVADSMAIARFADQRGEGPSLFPAEHDAAIVRCVELAERGLCAGRGISILNMLADDEALLEMVPRPVRRTLGPLARPVGAFGLRRTLHKYGSHADLAGYQAELITVLDQLRASLASSANNDPVQTVLASFTFADIALSQVVAFIAPPDFGLRFGRASRRAFDDPALKARYADLVTWRDRLYQSFRPRG